MKRRVGTAIAAVALAWVSGSTAYAQEEGYVPPSHAPLAPMGAFEIGVNAGYTQGFGDIAAPGANSLTTADNHLQDIVDAGLAVGVNLGYRATPFLSVGVDGTYQEFNADDSLPIDGTHVRGFNTGVHVTGHFMPYERVDPWVSVGAGYRALFIVPPGPFQTEATTGFQLAKLQVGLDMKVNHDVAIGPMVGADLNMFVWQSSSGDLFSNNTVIPDKKLNTFLFAGIQGRFDIGGERVGQYQAVGAR
jgi:hypothetical protein